MSLTPKRDCSFGVSSPCTLYFTSPHHTHKTHTHTHTHNLFRSLESTLFSRSLPKVPIPSYLIALVIGNLEKREIGPRSAVWSEPETVGKGAYEFAETEDYISTAESLLIPYEWGRYDILLLPGSFPYGGMENPCLTFVTPTLLAGDRSLSSVVAHEIAHSWCGNLVTNRSWEHFWLNEGFTVFVERKILGSMFGGEPMRHFHALIGWKHLKDSVDQFGADHEFTKLVPSLGGSDPDDAFSSVPYEKGFEFLFFLESLVGIKSFEEFLCSWIARNRGSTITTDEFRAYFESYFATTEKASELSKIDWDAWFHKPGMPPVDVRALFDKTIAQAGLDLTEKWSQHKGEGCTADDLKDWSTFQVVFFLDQLLLLEGDARPDVALLNKINSLYHLNDSTNSEIRFCWYMLGIQAGYEKVYDAAKAFLLEQGRMKFVRPLYRALHKNPATKEMAIATFKAEHTRYHNICSKMVATDLGISLA